MSLIENENAQAKDAWNRNAEFWNECIGEGNDFFNILLWPAVERYKTPFTQVGLAMRGQPAPHPYFHRPLSLLLAPALSAGFVLDGFEEQAFPADNSGGTTPLSWNGRFSEIPAALIVRLRHAM